MNDIRPGYLQKLIWSLPWLSRYPLWRGRETISRLLDKSDFQHLVFLVADHFEPAWKNAGVPVDLSTQRHRLDDWIQQAESIGGRIKDKHGRPFAHTYFFPGDEYFPELVDRLAEHQAMGFGEVEIHLHHGVETPDTSDNLRKVLTEFRDILAERHRCLSRFDGQGPPKYAFVHGNLALANSAGGRLCGVDDEMQILAETGCYADFTLPSAPNQSQVPRLNAIYECDRPLDRPVPHWSGPSLKVGGAEPRLPIIFTGPLVFNWRRRLRGFPVPRLDDGVLASNYLPDLNRFYQWQRAGIGVVGRPDWVFIKLFCHGFFAEDQPAMIGDIVKRFWESVLELAVTSRAFDVHFATAREAINMVFAAIDGHSGDPATYRDYRLLPIMKSDQSPTKYVEQHASSVFSQSVN